jgi:vitamin B12 transporter
MIRIKTGFAFIFSLLLLTANAQVELDPVTVTASVNPFQASRTGRNILVIKGEAFSKLPVHSIDELLRYLPGIEVQTRGPMGSQADIVMRGGTFQQVLVILDGIRLNDPNTGHFSAYIPIAPAEIDRIEVLKGASSAIYGSEAVGGVIHIITRSFAANPHAEPKKIFQLQAAGGEYDLWSVQAGGFYQRGSTAISGGLLTNNSHGQPQRGTRGSFNNHTASLSVKHFFSDAWSISARTSFDERIFSAQNFYTTFVSDTANEKVKTLWNQLQLVRQGSKDRLTIDLGYKSLDDRYQYNPGSVANSNQSNLWQALVKDEFILSDKTSFTAGTQFIHKRIASNDRGDHRLNQAAAFVILNQEISSSFFISPALRTDYHESSGWELVPQVNLSYRYTNWQFRASAGKTIREADFTERYNNYNKTLVTGGSIGNPDLSSERSFSYEAGADYYAGNRFRISGTFFQRLQKRLIDWTPTAYADMPRKDNLSPAGTYALARNIAEVNTLGAELDFQYHGQLIKGHQLVSGLGLVWLNSRGSDLEPSFYISSHARFIANGNLQYQNQRFAISVTGVYKNRKPQKASAINAELDEHCVMINSRLDIYLLANKLSVFTQMDNVFDNICQDLLGSQLPGRWLMGGLKLNLQ